MTNKTKNKSKSDVDNLINVVREVFPDAHAVVIFGDNGIDIISETKEFREHIERALEGRIIMTKEANSNDFYQ